MSEPFKKFFLKFTLFTLAVWGISFVVAFITSGALINRWYSFILLFLYFVGTVSSYLVIRSLKKNISGFANVFMIQNFLRLFLYSVVIFAYAYLHKNDAASFAITFFIYYLILTAWEVTDLKRIAK